MAHAKTTTTDKAQDKLLTRIAGAIERIGDARLGLGKLMREALASGLSKTALIKRVKELLPRNPAYYLGENLTAKTVDGLVSEADAIERNPGGFIHGTNVVRAEELGELGLTPSRQAALTTAIDNGLNDRPGVSVAAVASAIRSVRKNGKESDAGQKAVEKLMGQLAHAERYADAEEGSVRDWERRVAEAERAVERANEARNRANKALAEAKAGLKEAKAKESLAIAEASESEESDEPTPKAKAPAKPRARQPKGERIEAASAS